MSLNYKCPGCGAPIKFNPKIGGFKCEYCFNKYSEEELTSYLERSAAKKDSAQEPLSSGSGNGIKQYVCGNCGAEVAAGETSSASFCYYCHSPVILNDRLSGEFKPDKVIPFKIDKKEAVSKFKEWVRGKRYVPSDFTSQSTQDKITGIYLPYWQADIEADINYHAVGVSVSSWTSGDKEYTKTDKYDINRSGKIDINNIKELAFTKIDKNLINGISIYDEDEQIDFSAGYLAGFFAEQYDIKKEEAEPVFTEKAKTTAINAIRDSADYSSIEDEKDESVYSIKDCRYVLLPSWILTYLYKGKTYVFAVNGQTGKSFGELPLDKTRLALFSALVSAAAAGLLILGGLFIW
ncbi:hypothetical protein [Treponema pedis]|uniref:Uncharacterized protein n=2 Tax=Treponema pedis TaxID=409322 RepID=A0A7S6WPU5_9SPIR|nr:hypothetical protein [Treponema pedis]QOW60527.1 hypothetical protein IFE08_12070 [Treponema pedis]QSI03421.1 hypothetical protein DYQ05_00055 [Treponema pedis]